MTKIHTIKMAFGTATLLSSTVFATATLAADNETVDHTEVGSLGCDVGDGTRFIFSSTRELKCVFNPVTDGQADELYAGEINRYSLDIGNTQTGVNFAVGVGEINLQRVDG